MCPIQNGFRYLAGNMFLPSLSISNHNRQLTLHTDSHASDIGALRWEERKILRAKYRKPFGRGYIFIHNFFLRMTDTMTPCILTFTPGTHCIIYHNES
jgi:hypothetical protein